MIGNLHIQLHCNAFLAVLFAFLAVFSFYHTHLYIVLSRAEAARVATYSMYRYSVDRFRFCDIRRRTSQHYCFHEALPRTGSYSWSVLVT